MSRFQAGERILEIKEEIIDLVQEAMDLMRYEGTDTERERARGYWYAHIRHGPGRGQRIHGSVDVHDGGLRP